MGNYEDSYEEKVNKSKVGKKVKKKKSGILFGEFFSRGYMDTYLFWLIILLAIIGLIMIFSSSYYKSIQTYGDGYHFFKNQLVSLILGFGVMMVASKVNYNLYKKYGAPIIYGIAVILMAIVFIKGEALKGANRWINIGSFSFQPSEFMKIALCLFLANLLAARKDSSYYEPDHKLNIFENIGFELKKYKNEIFWLLLTCLIIFVENWSTAIIVFTTGVLMLYVDGFKLKRWIVAALVVIGGLIIFTKAGGIEKIQDLNLLDGKYNKRLERLVTWLDPFEDPLGGGYQTVQSLYGIGSGGIVGVGIGKSKLKLGYLPEAYNDMIFTIICEEFGLIGAIIVLGAFILLILECCKVAIKAPDKFSKYFVIGIISYITLQVLVNVGVATGVLPNTGMPLPFISYGGSSLLMAMFGMGIVLNISRYED